LEIVGGGARRKTGGADGEKKRGDEYPVGFMVGAARRANNRRGGTLFEGLLGIGPREIKYKKLRSPAKKTEKKLLYLNNLEVIDQLQKRNFH